MFEKQGEDQGDHSMVSGDERGWKRWSGLQKPDHAEPCGPVRTLVFILLHAVGSCQRHDATCLVPGMGV